ILGRRRLPIVTTAHNGCARNPRLASPWSLFSPSLPSTDITRPSQQTEKSFDVATVHVFTIQNRPSCGRYARSGWERSLFEGGSLQKLWAHDFLDKYDKRGETPMAAARPTKFTRAHVTARVAGTPKVSPQIAWSEAGLPKIAQHL